MIPLDEIFEKPLFMIFTMPKKYIESSKLLLKLGLCVEWIKVMSLSNINQNTLPTILLSFDSADGIYKISKNCISKSCLRMNKSFDDMLFK